LSWEGEKAISKKKKDSKSANFDPQEGEKRRIDRRPLPESIYQNGGHEGNID